MSRADILVCRFSDFPVACSNTGLESPVTGRLESLPYFAGFALGNVCVAWP